MSRRVTRRELLAGITAAGAAGTLSGVGTAALLVDRETLAASAAAGSVDLKIDLGNGPVDATGGPLALELSELRAGERDTTSFSLTVPQTGGANPVYLWLRAGCSAATTLGPVPDSETPAQSIIASTAGSVGNPNAAEKARPFTVIARP